MPTKYDMTAAEVFALFPTLSTVRLTIERVDKVKYLSDGVGFAATLEVTNGGASEARYTAHAASTPDVAIANIGSLITAVRLPT